MKYVLNTTNLPFLLTSLPLNFITSRPFVVNIPCQLEIEIPLLCIREAPLPDAFPLGNGSIPSISAVQVLCLSAILLFESSETILLSNGESTSLNNLRPIETHDILNYLIFKTLYFTCIGIKTTPIIFVKPYQTSLSFYKVIDFLLCYYKLDKISNPIFSIQRAVCRLQLLNMCDLLLI